MSGEFPSTRVMNNFFAAILHGTPLAIPGTEGVKGLTLSNAMHLSSWLDRTVDLPLDEDLFYSELQKRIATSKYKQGGDRVLNMEGSYLLIGQHSQRTNRSAGFLRLTAAPGAHSGSRCIPGPRVSAPPG